MKLPFYDKNINLKSFVLELTQKCNHDCLFCYNVWKCKKYPKGEISTEDWKGLIRKLKTETKLKLISLSGGEPLLRKDAVELIRFMTSEGITSNLITNGSLITEKIAKNCVDAGVSVFEIALLSSNENTYNKITRSKDFKKMLEGIANVKQFDGKLVTVIVATKYNIKDVAETVEMTIALGSDAIMFNRFNPGGMGIKYMKQLLPSVQELREAFQTLNKMSEEYGISITSSVPVQPCLIDMNDYDKLRFGYCPSGNDKSYFTIDSLGNVRVCNHSPTIIGDIKKQSFKEIFENNFVNRFKEIIPEFCSDCRLKEKCRGGCKASAEVCFGCVKDNDPFLELNKKFVVKK
jgi:pyrroloquinoline quinone biosynthesis protein E